MYYEDGFADLTPPEIWWQVDQRGVYHVDGFAAVYHPEVLGGSNMLSPSDFQLHIRFDILIKAVYALHLFNSQKLPRIVEDIHQSMLEIFESSRSDPSNIFSCEQVFRGTSFPVSDHSRTYFPLLNSSLAVSVTKPLDSSSRPFVPINGELQIVTSLAQGRNVSVMFLDAPGSPSDFCQLDSSFFLTKGFRSEYVEFVVLHLALVTAEIACVIYWPPSLSMQTDIKAVSEVVHSRCIHGDVIYSKSFLLTSNGICSLARNAYGPPEKNTKAFCEEASLVHDKNQKYQLSVEFLFKKSSTDTLGCNARLSDFFLMPGEESFVRISETHEESIFIAEMVLNQNSLLYLNYHANDRCQEVSREIGSRLGHNTPNLIHMQELMVESGTVMSYFGLRDSNDVDVILWESLLKIDDLDSIFGSKNGMVIEKHEGSIHYNFHGLEKVDLFSDPKTHGYCHGLKFVSLQQLIYYKTNRGFGDKDKKDVQKIKSFLNLADRLNENRIRMPALNDLADHCKAHSANLEDQILGVQEWMLQDDSIGLLYPYYTSEFIMQVLDVWEFSDKSVLECGGGHSTLWWASKARYTVTFERSLKFACALRNALQQHNLSEYGTVLWSPETDRISESEPLSTGCIDSIGNSKFDVIIIDGKVVDRCKDLLDSLAHLNVGGVIIADNFNQPEVWFPCPCCDHVEEKYVVHHYSHSGWIAKGHPDTKPHTNGWHTVWFMPDSHLNTPRLFLLNREEKSVAARRVDVNCRPDNDLNIAFTCGYLKTSTLIAKTVFSEYFVMQFSEALEIGCELNFRSKDVLLIGMFGDECIWKDFPGQVLFINGEAEGDLPSGAFGVGPYEDSPVTVRLYFVALAAFRTPFRFFAHAGREFAHTGSDTSTRRNKDKFLLYVSSQCHRHREAAFDNLAKIGQVWSGGKCKGSGSNGVDLWLPARDHGWESSIPFYHDFRFALVMENTKRDGYITEKILVAFASGAVPIYYGTEEVFKIFNRAALIYYDIDDAESALERVAYLELNRSAYEEMQSEHILANDKVLQDYFSLDETVGNGTLKQKIRTMMQLRDRRGVHDFENGFLRTPANPVGVLSIMLPFCEKVVNVLNGKADHEWWIRVANGDWEPSTFRVFNQAITQVTTYVGIGEWVGVTGLFALQRASEVIMVEADPIAFAEMKENVRLNSEQTSSRVILDSRCISNISESKVMFANGGSGSSIVHRPSISRFPKIHVECTAISQFVAEYELDTKDHVFVKIDVEGGESLILPSLLSWILSTGIRPTLFFSMHMTADSAERASIAALLNTYPYFAIFEGRNSTHEVSGGVDGTGVDTGECDRGVVLARNPSGKRFTSDIVCNWCDYFLTTDLDSAREACSTHQKRADERFYSEQFSLARQQWPEQTDTEYWLQKQSRTWISLSVCLDTTTNLHNKSGRNYVEAATLAVKTWASVTGCSVIVTVVSANASLESNVALQKLRQTGAVVQHISPVQSLGCVTTAQVARMFVSQHHAILPEDIIITADADCFPVNKHVLDPIKQLAFKAWVWQHSWSEETGYTFPISLLGMRAGTWTQMWGLDLKPVLSSTIEMWSELSNLKAGYGELYQWGLDQRMVTRALLEKKICSVQNPIVWHRVGLFPSPWRDVDCFHGTNEHRHGDMDPKSANWIHMQRDSTLHDVQMTLNLSATLTMPDQSSQCNHEPLPTNVHFLSYATDEFHQSRSRLTFEAQRTGWFTNISILGPQNLSPGFNLRYGEMLKFERMAGFGIWKAEIIQDYLQHMSEGEFLVYLDAGCSINIEGKSRLIDYLKMIEYSSFDILSFELSKPEHWYATQHVFKYFNTTERDSFVYETAQLAAGILIMRKGGHLRQFLSKVQSALVSDPWLFSDIYNDGSRMIDPFFVDGRHEQSIMSVVRKLIGSIVLKDETWPPPLPQFPFWATRIRP